MSTKNSVLDQLILNITKRNIRLCGASVTGNRKMIWMLLWALFFRNNDFCVLADDNGREEFVSGNTAEYVENKNYEKLMNVNNVIRSFESDIPQDYIDENSKLNTHLLLYPQACESMLINESWFDIGNLEATLYGRKILPVADEAENQIFGFNSIKRSAKECNFVCVERGVDKSQIQYVLPHLYFLGKDNNIENKRNEFNENVDVSQLQEQFWSWLVRSCNRVSLGFINYYTKNVPLRVHWVNEHGEYNYVARLRYGEQYSSSTQTLLGHTFAFEDPTTKEMILHYTVEFEGVISIGNFHIEHSLKERTGSDIQGLVKNTLRSEWRRHNAIKRTFSELGFAKGRLPEDLYASMSAYYYNNKPNIHLEEWGDDKGVYVNWWENDVHVIPIADNVKNLWQRRLLDLVQEWIDVNENHDRTLLEQTSLYGMRQYNTGARLLTHVDRETTHAASLIVNIAQGMNNHNSTETDEPWKLEIYDHADRLHEITMEPGDIVYYESAKCLHGRNKPLKGGYYVNLFTHYRPLHDPGWFRKDNPPGTPQPMLGDINPNNKVASRFLSSSKEIVTSGDDLYEWWKQAGINNIAANTGDEL